MHNRPHEPYRQWPGDEFLCRIVQKGHMTDVLSEVLAVTRLKGTVYFSA
jgi:hypothetical protein